MANYSYIDLLGELTEEAFEAALTAAAARTLNPDWKVERASFEDGGPVWMVTLPGTAPEPTEETRKLPFFCQDEDVGFMVALQPSRVAFRHGPITPFERWAQGRIEEELADFFNVGVFYDATDRIAPPGTREYRTGTTYEDYVFRKWTPTPAELESVKHDFERWIPKGQSREDRVRKFQKMVQGLPDVPVVDIFERPGVREDHD